MSASCRRGHRRPAGSTLLSVPSGRIDAAVSAGLGTGLGRAVLQHSEVGELVAAHQGLSGIYALSDAHDAFAVRALLAQSAEKPLDIQYYIWRGDTAGYYLLKSLKEAADRGVRVRLLLDDNGTRNLDHVLYSLSQHPITQ